MILCITHSNDFYTIDIVQQHLEKQGYATFRYNSDELASLFKIKYHLSHSAEGLALEASEGKVITPSQIQAVWYRKLWRLKLPPELDPAYRDVYLSEYRSYEQMFFNAISHVPWINPMHIDHAVGGDKLHQLTTAKAAGLMVPETILTNDAQLVREFFEAHQSGVITKLHGALSRSMEGNTPFFYTTKLAKRDLEDLESLVYCPMIFQAYVPKMYELRIVYVAGEMFTGKISSRNEVTDWRTLSGIEHAWQPYELPGSIKEKIDRYMRSLQLRFGAIDMIRNTNGDYIFLEVNPQGEWGMLQKFLHYPIGETIAEKLIGMIK